MKKLYYLIILTVILGLVLTGCFLSNVGQVPATGQSGITYLTKGVPLSAVLVGLWHFDEESNVPKVADSSGNGNEGNVWDATTGVSGKFGNALSFNGEDNYVDCGNDSSLSITQGTWEAWIKFDALPSVAGHPMNPLAKANQYWIHGSNKDTDSDTTDAIVVKICVGGTRYCANTSSSFITVGEWYHVAGTYDGETLKLYVNGTLVDSNTAPSGKIDTGTQIMAVGTWSTLVDYFQGTIDEVRIWDKALTVKQIEDSFNYGIVIQKGMSQDEAVLGDHVTITLEVVTAPESVLITDTLPDELRYIPGTFKVDGVFVDPTVDGKTISYTLNEPCAHTIIFDAQVTSVEAKLYTVINEAIADGASASAELTIHPYEGFKKEVDDKYEDTKDGKVEVGELVQWVMTITVHNNFAWPISNATLSDRLGGELGMAGDGVDNNLNGEIDEGSPGDLDSTYNTIPSGTLDILVRGKKANKVHFKITGIYIEKFEGSCFDLGIFTDKNPAGKQCYTTDNTYEMNSGAVLKFIDPDPEGPGFQLSAHTCPIEITVEP